ncbi:sodium/hydrogen exchanger 9B2 [Stomoxys calcitrans]|uniref:sodium/hydrogen exchanger 9B2 n=1 Tax=Stomoxys calcitrans TaxID=35570 RepID=UPI0027E380D2|nr:sodium/hydrogen exchanger 9B2 [Stomoxys calcitrans]
MNNRCRAASTLQSGPTTSLDADARKEFNWQKAYNQELHSGPTTELKYADEGEDDDDGDNNDDDNNILSATQQANQISLEQIKNAQQGLTQRLGENVGAAEAATAKIGVNKAMPLQNRIGEAMVEGDEQWEANEQEHLLGGQVQHQWLQQKQPWPQQHQYRRQQQQQPQKVPTANSAIIATETAARVNFNDGEIKHSQEAVISSRHPENPVDKWTSNAATATATGSVEDIDLKIHSNLELQKIPQDMMQSHNSKEQNGSTIIQTPTSLTTPPTGGHNGGSGGTSDAEYKGPKVWQYLVRNYPVSSQPLAILLIFIGLWTLGYFLMPQYAGPNTVIMRIVLLFVGAQTAGILVTFINLPDMLGMLFFGVLYANVGLADFTGYAKFEGFLREMALINIMLLAGLGLDANAFKKLWFMITRLTLVPTIAEVSVIAALAYLLLNMSWLWGILLGLVITAVSPNVVVTVMLKLKEDRLGLNNGIHTLIYAMTTCNDVVAIFLFGVINGVIFSTGGSLTEQILQGPIGIGIGIVYGYLYGLMLQFVPSRNSTYVNGLRFVLTLLGGTISVIGSKVIKYPSAGALGCVTVAFIASMGWKRQLEKMTPQQRLANENASVSKRLDLLWKFLKPVSFSLIGKEINFAVLEGRVVGYGALVVLLGSLFRLVFAYVSTYGGNLSRKERAYITISGFPKATVQAALGPIALDMARELNAEADVVSLARNVLIISVLAIIFTAPLGAILMLRLAPKWLKHSPATEGASPPPNDAEDDVCSYHNDNGSNYNINSTNNNNAAQRVMPI